MALKLNNMEVPKELTTKNEVLGHLIIRSHGAVEETDLP
jgi:hypothetical protein